MKYYNKYNIRNGFPPDLIKTAKEFKQVQRSMSFYVKWYFPTLKEYGGVINNCEDLYEFMKDNASEFNLVALDLLYTNENIHELFTNEQLNYIKNTIRIYTKVCDSPCKLSPFEEQLNPEYNIYTKILEKYGWNE